MRSTASSPASRRSLLSLHTLAALRVLCPPSCFVPALAFLAGAFAGPVAGAADRPAALGQWGLIATGLMFLYLGVVAGDVLLDWEHDLVSKNKWKSFIPQNLRKADMVLAYVAVFVCGGCLVASASRMAFAIAFPVYALMSVLYSAGRGRISDSGLLRPTVLAVLQVGLPVLLGSLIAHASWPALVVLTGVLWLFVASSLLTRDVVRFEAYLKYRRSLPALAVSRAGRTNGKKLLMGVLALGCMIAGGGATVLAVEWSGVQPWLAGTCFAGSCAALLVGAAMYEEERRGWAIRVGTSMAAIAILLPWLATRFV